MTKNERKRLNCLGSLSDVRNKRLLSTPKKMDLSTFLGRLLLIFCPLAIAGLLCGQFIMDKAEYVALVKYNLLAIYSALFLATLFQYFQNPPRRKRPRDSK